MRNLSSIIENYLKQSPPLPNFEKESIHELRNRFNERQKSFNEKMPTYNLSMHDQVASTSEGDISMRIYRPQNEQLSSVLIFFHGGGFVFGNLDTLECHCREIAHFANCTVISIDYPLAPEHPYPSALKSAFAAVHWIYDHIIKSEQVFIGGSSSGATLAAALCIMLRDSGGPKLKGQILLCPMTDTSFNTTSYRENAVGYNLTRDHCIWFFSKYVSNLSELNDPLVAPLKTTNFKVLPPALMVTAEFDPLCDEGREYAKKLQDAGVECSDLYYKGMIHGFSTLPLQLPEKTNVLNHIKKFVGPT